MKNGLSKFFDIDGKLGRVGFLIRSIILYALIAIIYFVNNVIMAVLIELDRKHYNIKTGWLTPYTVIMTTILIIIVCSIIILQMQRLNDLNKKRGLTVLTFIPPINIMFFIFLIFAKGKYENDVIPNTEKLENKNLYISENENPKHIVNRDKKKILYRRLIILITLIILLGIGYYTLFYNQYNGIWEAKTYNRLITLEIYKDEELLTIYESHRKTIPYNEYEVVIFEKNKRNTVMGIDGGSHKLRKNRDILILELDNLYSMFETFNEDLYFKKVKKRK